MHEQVRVSRGEVQEKLRRITAGQCITHICDINNFVPTQERQSGIKHRTIEIEFTNMRAIKISKKYSPEDNFTFTAIAAIDDVATKILDIRAIVECIKHEESYYSCVCHEDVLVTYGMDVLVCHEYIPGPAQWKELWRATGMQKNGEDPGYELTYPICDWIHKDDDDDV